MINGGKGEKEGRGIEKEIKGGKKEEVKFPIHPSVFMIL